ncbi:MAG: CHRD domain-containing protein [Sphingosinicella sp.]
MRMLSFAGVTAVALVAAPAHAQSVFVTTLAGGSENPPAASPGTGVALVVLDANNQTMTVRTTFSQLTTPTTDAHIHCCVPPTANAGVAVGFRPAGFPLGVTSGQFSANFDLNALATYNPPFVAANGGTAASARTALLAGMQNGLSYVNIHSSAFPGGEIRGQLLTGRSLTAEAYTLLPEAALQTTEFQDVTVRRYLRSVRGGDQGFDGRSALVGDGRMDCSWSAASAPANSPSAPAGRRSNSPRRASPAASIFGWGRRP